MRKNILKRGSMVLILTMLLGTGVFAGTFVKPDYNEKYGSPNNIDAITEIYNNGDGTFDMYIELAENAGGYPNPFKPDEYVVDQNDRYKAMRFALSDKIIPISCSKVTPNDGGETYVEFENNQTQILWGVDLGMKPEHFITTPFFKIPQNKRNTMKLTFKIKEDVSGTIMPVEDLMALYYSGIDEFGNRMDAKHYMFLKGIQVDEPQDFTMNMQVYKDKAMTEICEETKAGQKVYIKIEIKNQNNQETPNIMINLDQNIQNLEKDGTLIKDSFLAGEKINIGKLQKDQTINLTGEMEIDTDQNSVVINADVNGEWTYVTNILDGENIINKPENFTYKAKADMGNEQVNPRVPGAKKSFIYGVVSVQDKKAFSHKASKQIKIEKSVTVTSNPNPNPNSNPTPNPNSNANGNISGAVTPASGNPIAGNDSAKKINTVKTGDTKNNTYLYTLMLLLVSGGVLTISRKKSVANK